MCADKINYVISKFETTSIFRSRDNNSYVLTCSGHTCEIIEIWYQEFRTKTAVRAAVRRRIGVLCYDVELITIYAMRINYFNITIERVTKNQRNTVIFLDVK